MLISHGTKGWFAAVIVCLWGLSLPQARAVIYNLTYEVTVTSTTDMGTIAPSSVAVGDKFAISFQLNDTSLMTWKEPMGLGGAFFQNALAGLQVTADASNAGTWIPTWTWYNSAVSVLANEMGGTDFYFSFQPSGGSTVANAGGGSAMGLSSFNVMLRTGQGFNSSLPVGTPLSAFFPPSSEMVPLVPGSMFRFEAGDSMPLMFLGNAAPVPEPSTCALLGLGAGALCALRRRKA